MDKPLVIDIPLHIDDRGTVHCILDELDSWGIKRTYMVKSWAAGMIRAWHGHNKADTYMHVVSGTVKFAAKPIEENIDEDWTAERDVVTATISAEKPQVFFVPAGWFNGAMSITENTKVLVYSTLTFDEVKLDDVRGKLNPHENARVFGVKHR